MIVTVPMICENSLRGDNAVPIIAKAFERWVLLYSIDKITAAIASKSGTGVRFVNTNESTQVDNYLTYLNEFSNISEKGAAEPYVAVNDDIKKPVSVGKADFSFMQSSLDINPTWIKLTVKGVPRLVGVKVLPYFMNPKVKAISVVMKKDLPKGLVRMLITAAVRRWIISKFWSFLKGLAKLVGWHFAVSGKAKDIIHNSSEFGVNTLACFGELDLPTIQKLLSSSRSVRNLFIMGWSGFAVRMKSHKATTFCMPQMKGLCSTVSDADLYGAFGKSGNQVYNSVNDLTRAFKF